MLYWVGLFCTRLFLVVIAGSVLSSCSTESVIQNVFQNREYIADTLQRPVSVADARGTFLLKSSRIFYPNGIPQDPSVLPQLTAAQIKEIERLLERVIERVSLTQRRHAPLLARTFSGLDITRGIVGITILSQGQAIAATEKSGRMYVDGKVVQAIYRSALLAVLVDDETVGAGKDREQLAFARFSEFNNKLGGMSSFLPLSDINGFAKSAKRNEGGGLLDNMMFGAFGILETRLNDMALMEQSRALEEAFLGAIEFLAAHETAHLVLGHFPLTGVCADARTREFDADQYAVLVNAMAQFDSVSKITLDRVDSGGFSASGAAARSLMFRPEQYYRQFFRHAYGLAGFDSMFAGIVECAYPPYTEREKTAQPYSEIVKEIIEDARWADGLRRSGDRGAREALGSSPFESYYDSMRNDAKKRSTEPTLQYLERNRALLRDLFYTYYRPAD